MICFQCKKDFKEKDIQESHNIPCYLFVGNRKGRKNQADKFGRHWLCQKCHKKYEYSLNLSLRIFAEKFGKEYFEKEKLK